MKKIIAIVVAVALAVGTFIFSVSYRNKKNEEYHQSLLAVSSQEDESQGGSKNEPVLVSDDGEYELYVDGEIVKVIKGDYEIEMNNWVDSFNTELPKIVSEDIDNDDENELLLKVYAAKHANDDGTKTSIYAIFLLDPVINANGEKTFEIATANTNTWVAPFAETVRAEVTQLKSCKKILQFAMESIENQIVYDENGLGTGDYVGYAAALSDNKKEYYTYKNWSLGQGVYDLDDDGNITLQIQVLVEYEEIEEKQIIGFINCKIQLEDGVFSIVPKEIYFEAMDDYRVSDPREATDKKWSVTLKNTASRPDFQNNSIDWIDCKFDVSSMSSSQSQSFSNITSKIKCVDTVKFTQSSITMTAKDGYLFYGNAAENGSFSVILNEGEKNETDIAYTCNIKNEGSESVLVIKLDGNYAKSDLDSVSIKFGT